MDVDVRALFPQNQCILWDAVTDAAAAAVTKQGDWLSLNLLEFACSVYLNYTQDINANSSSYCRPLVSPDIAKTKVTGVYQDLLEQLTAKASSPSDQAKITCILITQAQCLGLFTSHNYQLQREESSLKLFLHENQLQHLLKYASASSCSAFSSQLVGQLTNLLLENPFLAHAVINKFQDILSISPKTKDSHPLWPRLITNCLFDKLTNAEGDGQVFCQLLHLLPEDESYSQIVLSADLSSILPPGYSDTNSFLMTCLISRPSTKLYNAIYDFKWQQESSSPKLLFKSNEDVSNPLNNLDITSCLLLALREKTHFIDRLISYDISTYDLLPKIWRLFYLVIKIHLSRVNFGRSISFESSPRTVKIPPLEVQKSATQSQLTLYLEKLQELITINFVRLSNYSQLTTNLVTRLQWIFKLTDWAFSQVGPTASPFVNQTYLKESLVMNLINCEPALHTLSKFGILKSLNFSSDTTTNELVLLLHDSNLKTEIMILFSYLALALAFKWLFKIGANENKDSSVKSSSSDQADNDSLTGEHSDVDDAEYDEDDYKEADENSEFGSRLKFLVNNIKILTLRTEVLENMYSFLFLTRSDLTDKSCEEGEEESQFLAVNNNVFRYLAVLKDMIFETQRITWSITRKLDSKKPDYEYDDSELEYFEPASELEVTSIKSLAEAKSRLDTLMRLVNEANWRYSVVESAVTEEKNILDVCQGENKCQHSIMRYMLSSPTELLRFALVSGHVERARQVYRLFDKQLAQCDEVTQLLVIEKINDLYDKIKLLLMNHQKKQAHPPLYSSPSGMRSSEMEIKQNLQLSQFLLILDKFLADVSALDPPFASIILIDYALTKCTNLDVTQLALDMGLKYFPKSQTKGKMLDFLLQLGKLITNLKNASHTYEYEMSLPQLLVSNFHPNLFTTPNVLLQEAIHHKKLKECVEDIRQLLFSETIYDTERESIQFARANSGYPMDYSNVYSHATSSSPASSGQDSKNLIVLFQKLLRLVPCGKHNFLKGLFYHVRRVSEVLNECKQRSRSLSNPKIDFTSSKNSSLDAAPSSRSPQFKRKESLTSTYNSSSKFSIHSPTSVTPSSFFSVLYQSPSAILCQMILKENIPPHLVDDLSNQMKIDLIGTLCSILCPPLPVTVKYDELSLMSEFSLINSCYPALCDLIESHLTGHLRRQISCGQREEDSSILIENHFNTDASPEEFDQEYNRNIISKSELIVYFRSKSPIVVELLRLLKLIDERKISLFDEPETIFNKSTPLGQYICKMNSLFGNSGRDETSIVALSLHPFVQVTSSVVLKSLEKYAETRDLHSIHRILEMTHGILSSEYPCKSMSTLEAALLSKLAITSGEIRYLLQMKDSSAKVALLLDMIAGSNDTIDSTSSYLTDPSEAIKALTAIRGSVLASAECNPQLVHLLDTKLKEVSCYSKIASLAGLKRWKDAQDSLTEADILTILKAKKHYSLALKWNELIDSNDRNSLSSDTQIEYLRNELLVLSYAEKGEMEKTNCLVKELVESKNEKLVIKCISQIDNWNMKQVLMEQLIEHEKDPEGALVHTSYLLGLKLIQLLQPQVRIHYAPLVSSPSLIIEQMLMNTEYQALEQALRVQRLINCDDLIESYAKKAVDIKLIGEDCLSLAGSEYTCISSSILPSPSIYSASSQTYTMPTSVPSRDQWIPDRKVTHCMVCKIEKFSVIFNRKHHCRRCGRVACSSCSDRLIVIPEIHPTSPVRVCIHCFSSLKASQPSLASDISSRISERRESMSSHSSSISIYQWILSLDKEQNRGVRSEFYFEAAPSASLCLSILRLHSDANACVKLIIDQLIRNLFEVLTSSQIDYGLLLTIIKSLLVAAKVIIESNRSTVPDANSRIKYVDLMLSRVDIVRMLVEQNCINKELINYIILNESQSNNQSLVKLMEKLLEVERFELALNLAKKNGLEVKGIWKTWAIICLRSGKFAEARAKWKHVMVGRGASSASGSNVNGRNLQLIIDILADQRTNVKLNQRTTLKERVDLIRKGKASQLCRGVDVSSSLAEPLLTEAKYYLDLYGGREDWVRFYSRFGRWKESLDILLNESNPTVLFGCFVNDFLLQAVHKSSFTKVLALMKSSDPTLGKCSKYLIASCRYFTKNGYFNVLHSMQLFMTDYLRAAITQVTHFYLARPYSGYDVLLRRLDHLLLARNHLTCYLEHRTHLSSLPYVLNQPVEQVKRNVRTINYQVEITRAFADRSVDATATLALEDEQQVPISSPSAVSPNKLDEARETSISRSLQSNSPNLHPDSAWLHTSLGGSLNFYSPRRKTRSSSMDSSSTIGSSANCPLTLLDESKKKRTQLTAIVIVEFGSRISDGFAMACKLIHEYKLEIPLVLRLAGRLILNGKKATVIDRLNQLLNCIKNSHNQEIGETADSVLSCCIRNCNEADLVDPMIKLITSDITKIDAYIQTGRLRPAYLLAVRLEREGDVRRILSVAEKTEQEIVRTWCTQWLQKNAKETDDTTSN